MTKAPSPIWIYFHTERLPGKAKDPYQVAAGYPYFRRSRRLHQAEMSRALLSLPQEPLIEWVVAGASRERS